jgi:hypothetical protein
MTPDKGTKYANKPEISKPVSEHAMREIFKLGPIAVIFLMVFTATGIARADENEGASICRKKVEQFLSGPSKRTFLTLRGAADDSACWPEMSKNDKLDRLQRIVERGNPWGARYLVKHLRGLDGGNLEDSFAALGQFGDLRAADLLRFAKMGLLRNRDLANAMTMLPLSTGDDLDEQLKAMQKRRDSMEKVRDNDQAEKKTIALETIDAFMAEIASHK